MEEVPIHLDKITYKPVRKFKYLIDEREVSITSDAILKLRAGDASAWLWIGMFILVLTFAQAFQPLSNAILSAFDQASRFNAPTPLLNQLGWNEHGDGPTKSGTIRSSIFMSSTESSGYVSKSKSK